MTAPPPAGRGSRGGSAHRVPPAAKAGMGRSGRARSRARPLRAVRAGHGRQPRRGRGRPRSPRAPARATRRSHRRTGARPARQGAPIRRPARARERTGSRSRADGSTSTRRGRIPAASAPPSASRRRTRAPLPAPPPRSRPARARLLPRGRSAPSRSRRRASPQGSKRRPERLPAAQHGLEEIAVALDPLQRLTHPEVAGPNLLAEILPPQRRRDGRTRFRANRVDRRDRLAVTVLAVVDEHAAPLLLQPLGGHKTGVLRFELAQHTLGELVGLGGGVAPRDRHEHVDPVGAARLHIRAQLEPLERLPHQVSDLDRLRKAVARLRRVEVEDDVVRLLGLVDARVPRVHVDAVHLHHPHERSGLVDQREVDEARAALARPGTELARREPRRLPLRRLLVEVRLAANAVRVALERERAVAQVRHDRRGYLDVVGGEIALRDAVAREEVLVRAREPDAAAPDPELLGHLRRVQLSLCLRGNRYGPVSSGRARANSASRSAARNVASALVVEYIVSSSAGVTVSEPSARCSWSGSKGESAKTSSNGGRRWASERSYGSLRSAIASSGSGGSVSHQWVQNIASPPRGRNTRAISAMAAAGSNQWNASPTNTASTLWSSSGIASALPSRAEPCTSRIRFSGSTATTSAKRLASSRVRRPVPAARSRTRALRSSSSTSCARSSSSGGYGGRTRSYVSATFPKLRRSSDKARPVRDRPGPPPDLAAGRNELPETGGERVALFVGLMCDRAHGEHVRDPFVAGVDDVAHDLRLAQLLERPALERPAPFAREHAPQAGLAAAFEDLADQRFGFVAHVLVVDADVPEDDQGSAGPQHAGDLGDRVVGREPVEGLGREDGVDLAVRGRDRLGAASARLRSGNHLLEHPEHRRVRLDRDHASEPRDERAGQLAGAGAEVEHGRVRPQPELIAHALEQLLRPFRPAELVLPGGSPECVRRSLSTRHRQGVRRDSPSASRGRSRAAGSGSCPRRSA